MPDAISSSSSATMSGYDTLAAPSLALSDIMHNMTPSPVPPEDSIPRASGIRAASPDPLTETDILAMRRRITQLGLRMNGSTQTTDSNLSSREKELVDMVLRLTASLPVDAAQLHRQAETIANLTAQRDHIVREIVEERERWRAEREVWDRTAEALLSQRTKTPKSEDAIRQREMHEAETRALRDRLHDAQRRLSHLEAELLRLRPLLLMQPYPKGKYGRHDPGHSNSRHGLQTQENGEPLQDKGKGREMEPPQSIPAGRSLGTIPEDQEFRAGPSQFQPSSTHHHHHRRRSRDRHGTSSKTSKRKGGSRHTPLSSDAYAEHLLLAAKRIGRQRATYVSGLMQRAEREKELLTKEQQRTRDMQEQERLERERLDRLAMGTAGHAYYRSTADGTPQRVLAMPHTPKKQIHYGPSASTTPIVFVHTTPPSFSASHITSNGVSRGQQMAVLSNPPTPLDSLLDAARMMDDGPSRKANGKGRALEEPETPMPKRRRVSGAGRAPLRPPATNGDGGRPIPVPDRVRSALDVLADQAAAAFDDTEQSDRRAAAAAAKGAGSATQPTSRGYGQVKDSGQGAHSPAQADNAIASSSSSSGRTRTRGRAPPSFASTSTATSSTHGASASASGRSLRNAAKRHPVLSAELDSERAAPLPPQKAPPARGTSRPRGRPRANASKARGAGPAEASEPRVISPAHTRVIVPPPPSYAMGRDATPTEIASQASDRADVDMNDQEDERLRSPVPPAAGNEKGDTGALKSGQGPGVHETRSRSKPFNNSTEVQEGRDDDTLTMNSTSKSEAKFPPSLPSHAASVSVLESTTDILMSSKLTTSFTQTALRHALPSDVTAAASLSIVHSPMPPLSASVLDVEMKESTADDDESTDKDADADTDTDEDADAEADVDEDQDAEGEQEDDVEGESRDVPTRSKSPPPPGPPPPGADGGPPPGNDGSEPDADADAEGDMDLEEGDEPADGGGNHASGTREMSLTRGSGLHRLVQDGPLEAATASMSSDYLTSMKGKSRMEGGLNGVHVHAEGIDRWGMPGEVSQVISLEKSSGVPIIKWGKKVDIFLPDTTLNDVDFLIGRLGLSKSKPASSWHIAGGPSIEYFHVCRMAICHASQCEPPFRPFVLSTHPIIEVS